MRFISATTTTTINNRNNTFNKENKGAVRFTIHLQIGRRNNN